MLTKDQIDFQYNDNRYIINAMDASYGIEVMNKFQEFVSEEKNPSAAFMKGVVLRSVTFNNKAVDEKWFDKHFSRNYAELNAVFIKIMEFNFGEMGEEGVPNEQSVTSE